MQKKAKEKKRSFKKYAQKLFDARDKVIDI